MKHRFIKIKPDDKKWEYQGKRKDQVESSYKIFAFSIVAVVILLIIKLFTL